MTEPSDLESALRSGMHETTSGLVAGPALQRRLIDAAASGQRAARVVSGRRFRTTWTLPASAAAVVLLTVGLAVVVSHTDGGTSRAAGTVDQSSLAGPSPSAVAPSASAPALVPGVRVSTVTVTEGASATDSPTNEDTPTAPLSLHAACSAPANGSIRLTTKSDFIKRIVGTWLACKSPSIFGTPDAGLRIGRDGQWAKLVRNSAHHLIVGTGLNDQGTWKVIDVSAMNGHPAFQLNLLEGAGTVVVLPEFAHAVTRMTLDNNGVYVDDYVPTTEPVAG